MRALTYLALITACALAAPPAAKPPQPRLIRVPASVVDPGAGGPAFAATDLSALVDGGRKARIVRVRGPQDDLLLIVVFDLVGDLALVDPARQALVDEFRKLPPKTHTALMRSQDGLQVILDPTSDAGALENGITAMAVNGKAGLLETVETAVQLADAIGAKTGVRVGLLYVTDSDVRNYREDFTNPVINSSDSRDLSRRFPEGLVREKLSKIKENVLGSQTPVFVVHLSYSSERLNEAYQSGLLEIANVTGGSATFCRSSAEIPEAISKTVATIVEQYHVFVELPDKMPKKVNVTLASRERKLSHRSLYILR